MNKYVFEISYPMNVSGELKTARQRGRIDAIDTSEAILDLLRKYPNAKGEVKQVYADGYVPNLEPEEDPIDAIAFTHALLNADQTARPKLGMKKKIQSKSQNRFQQFERNKQQMRKSK